MENDLISRQAAIDAADAVWSVTGDKNVAKVWDQLKDLPPAQPEIIRCRECQHWKQGELVDKCGLLDCYADADCYCTWAVRERRQK